MGSEKIRIYRYTILKKEIDNFTFKIVNNTNATLVTTLESIKKIISFYPLVKKFVKKNCIEIYISKRIEDKYVLVVENRENEIVFEVRQYEEDKDNVLSIYKFKMSKENEKELVFKVDKITNKSENLTKMLKKISEKLFLKRDDWKFKFFTTSISFYI